MMQILSRVLLLSQLWTQVSGQRERIVGGREAEDGRYPYAVNFQNDLGQSCGGSLISRDVVLSAAHCGDAFIGKVVSGRHNLDTDEGEEMNVAATLSHPEYNDETIDNDIMLIFLQDPTDPGVEFVKLNSDESSPDIGASVTVAGWGRTDEAATASDVLLAVDVNVIPNAECEQSKGLIGEVLQSYEGKISNNMMCAKDDGKDSCQGDSGGPLVLKRSDGSADVQVGVVSWGEGCARKDFPGVYARVSHFY
ncbi:hypothetical protein ACHAXR_004182, partial [Thalassiosira sp. AJA248-18]